MPQDFPQHQHAAAAHESLRALTQTVRDTSPDQLYAVANELIGITRMLPDVLRKLSALALSRSDEATHDLPFSGRSAQTEIETAARHLIAASEQIDTAKSEVDHASQCFWHLTWPASSSHSAHASERDFQASLPDAEMPVLRVARLSALASPERYQSQTPLGRSELSR